MDAAKLEQLKLFISRCQSDPSILSDPSLSFFRDYLESLGAKLPASAYKTESQSELQSQLCIKSWCKQFLSVTYNKQQQLTRLVQPSRWIDIKLTFRRII
ncbi:putative hsp70-interacting protein [Helianthus annuus]|nr:putative hsp70-interacting protein [Helianthus annuus]